MTKNKNNKKGYVSSDQKKTDDLPTENSLWKIVSGTVNPLSDREREFNIHLEQLYSDHFEDMEYDIDEQKGKQKNNLSDADRKRLQKQFATSIKSKNQTLKNSKNLQKDYLQHGESPGVDKRTAQRLKRGRLQIDAKLDLHGHGIVAAHQQFLNFVLSSHAVGHRCLLIVTGKGEKGKGIIRQSVPQWLNDAPIRHLILSYNYAQPSDGGQGAIYVLLKRIR